MNVPLAVVVATGNPGKAKEFDRLLSPSFRVRAMPAETLLPKETGTTFVENSRLKAETVFAALGGVTAVLADDSGLEVTALGGRPGVLSARFAGEGARDEANVARLLAELEGRADRGARFVCALCLVAPGALAGSAVRRIIEVQGTSSGTIAPKPRGDLGFGYDPVFIPDGWTLTLAEASPEEKDEVSHRGAAARLLMREVAARGWLLGTEGAGGGR